MKCPVCGYIDGYDIEASKKINGDNGTFFTLPIEVVREDSFDRQREKVYACPKYGCGALFIVR